MTDYKCVFRLGYKMKNILGDKEIGGVISVSVCEENRRQMLGTVKSVIPAVQSNNP
jgi:hypothetical protein